MRRLLCAAVVVATLMAGGCGIPDESDVTIVDNGPSGVLPNGGADEPPVQPRREDNGEPKTLVSNYLQAAAGDPETAAARMKAFLAPDKAARFPSGSDIKVVRETEASLHSPGESEVSITIQVVGTLKANGVLEPAAPSDSVSYTLRVGPVSGRDGQFILEAPQMLMMTDVALQEYYSPRTIYWWNTANTGLVPDVRYMPLSVPSVQQPTTVLNWLTGPPAAWLDDTVNSLPQGTQASDNVTISGDTLRISLNAQAVPQGSDPGALDRLRRQLQWSMRPLTTSVIEIKIGHDDAVSTENGAYLDSNAAYRLADVPERFALYGSSIRRLKDSPHASDPVPVIKPAANKNITSAALSSSSTRAYLAVVTGADDARKLRVAQAPLGEMADLQPVGKLTGDLGTPVWAQTPDGDEPSAAVGLITMGGQVYTFDATGGAARRIDWPNPPGPVTSLSVAPDGHRVVLVSGDRLYRAVLNTSGDEITLSDPERVHPPDLKTVAAAAWNSESSLAVAGMRTNNRYAVLDVTVDGTLATTRLGDIGAEPVTYLTAYPSTPTNPERLASEWYVAGGDAWDVLSEPVLLRPEHLADVTPQPGVDATAPFFMD
ncbi:LpqB family beta-propeller domain-containing protein [Paractinoplanes brasiliensis]|uniref:Lipoprotein LpqB-like beta-propeller protein n=1 Tax=Paractinoplanes brasiliensis TaxID=52695 RepID=A0A4V3C7Q6_9ACTN|nr:LpqB family beta-propeller domain-containing protein [Actinoplanes brasiliensis]TDO38548.1 lipoprotein LpqB-like beta-propeller protein [Actinoplanes brasiliensis]GID26677.1 hypothetical protein Abr02nite_16600 [Actinoplanes brasiliensis]